MRNTRLYVTAACRLWDTDLRCFLLDCRYTYLLDHDYEVVSDWIIGLQFFLYIYWIAGTFI